MAQPEPLLAVDAAGRGVSVHFAWASDRWRHTIHAVEGGRVTLLLASREGTAADDWPASPPFQELSRETLPDGRTVLFLVGRGGSSHWSASIEAAISETSHEPPRLIFDIACRHSAAPPSLGSLYERASPEGTIEVLEQRGMLTHRAGEARIAPAEIAAATPGTTRWKYAVFHARA